MALHEAGATPGPDGTDASVAAFVATAVATPLATPVGVRHRPRSPNQYPRPPALWRACAVGGNRAWAEYSGRRASALRTVLRTRGPHLRSADRSGLRALSVPPPC